MEFFAVFRELSESIGGVMPALEPVVRYQQPALQAGDSLYEFGLIGLAGQSSLTPLIFVANTSAIRG